MYIHRVCIPIDVRMSSTNFKHKNSLSFFSCTIFHHGQPSKEAPPHLVIRGGCHQQSIVPLPLYAN